LAHSPKSAPSAQKSLHKVETKMSEASDRLAKLTLDQTSTNAEIARITKARDDAQTAIDKLSADYKLSRQKLAGLKQDTLFEARNSPILDMVNPSLRVQQVQLPEHYNDVNFMKIPRVDRCATCHIAADRKGFEDAQRVVFRTHPKLNL